METVIFHAGNAGLFFYRNGTGILVDGIYDGGEVGMSPMPEQWKQDMLQCRGLFERTSGLIFTHLHPDHYNKALTEQYLAELKKQGKRIFCYGPGWEYNNVTIKDLGDGMECFQIGTAEIITRQTIHDGEIWRKDFHNSLLIKMGDESFFIAGDAELFETDADAFLQYTDEVQMAFVNLYQLNGKTGQDCLAKIQPQRVMLYHLPYEEDDSYHYLQLSRQIVRKFARACNMQPEVMEHMSWVDHHEIRFRSYAVHGSEAAMQVRSK